MTLQYITFCLGMCLVYTHAFIYFNDNLNTEPFADKWVKSSTRTDDDDAMGDFKSFDKSDTDTALHASDKAKYYTMFAPLDTPIDQTKEAPVAIQYSIQLENKDFDCGGAYLKVGKHEGDLAEINHETPYSLMFGPDFQCNSQSKVHAIFNDVKKDTHWKKAPSASVLKDGKTHVFSMFIYPNNTYEYRVDGDIVESDNISKDWDLLPPKRIKDPAVTKPADWPEKRIKDPDHVKPSGFDDIPKTIVDETAEKPDDWEDEDDGEWEAPELPNPEYKGPWKDKFIDNPEWEGEWEHPLIDNPEYNAEDEASVYKQVHDANVVGLELWHFTSGVLFDDFIITDDVDEALNAVTTILDNSKVGGSIYTSEDDDDDGDGGDDDDYTDDGDDDDEYN